MKSDYDGEGLSHDLLHTAPRHFKFKFFPRLAFTHGHVYFIFYIGASLGHQSIFGWQSSKQKRYFFMLSCTAHLFRIYKQENIVSVQLDWISLLFFYGDVSIRLPSHVRHLFLELSDISNGTSIRMMYFSRCRSHLFGLFTPLFRFVFYDLVKYFAVRLLLSFIRMNLGQDLVR